MKEIRVLVWCDGPHENVNIGDGVVTHTIRVNNMPDKSIDLCERCAVRFIEPLVALLKEAGVEPEAPPKPPKRAKPNPPCPDCGHQAPNRSALGAHLKAAHGKGLRSL